MKITLLGTGTSTGVPVIGCRCSVCTSQDPRNKRLRCSCHIEVDGLSLLIDAGPDFRTQALRHPFPHLDAILFTHHHFDHVAGLDDVRPFLYENTLPIPCYAPAETAAVLRRMYRYIFEDGTYPGVPSLELHTVQRPFHVTGRYDQPRTLPITPVPVYHGDAEILGYRIGDFAYLTDTSGIPDSSHALLKGVQVLVLDALKRDPHPMHFTIDEAVAAAERIGARETYFIHMTHTVDHAVEQARLPAGVFLAYDGLQLIL